MESFKNFLKSLKRKRSNPLAICPKCGNPKVSQLNSLSGWLTPSMYVCNKCGYTGPILLEVDSSNDLSEDE